MAHFGHAAGFADVTSGCFGQACAAGVGAGALATGGGGAVAQATSGAAIKNASTGSRVFMPTGRCMFDAKAQLAIGSRRAIEIGMKIDRDRFLSEVMWRAAIPDAHTAETAVEATLEALGERLSARDAARFAEYLPPTFAAALLRLSRHTAPKPTALFVRVAVTEGVSPGVAVEHAETVCHALAEALDNEARSFLQHRLPPDWAALFVPRAQASPSPPGPVPGHGHTLATGRPGRRLQ